MQRVATYFKSFSIPKKILIKMVKGWCSNSFKRGKIYSKLLGQYGRHECKQILESAIYVGEKSKRLILNRNWL